MGDEDTWAEGAAALDEARSRTITYRGERKCPSNGGDALTPAES